MRLLVFFAWFFFTSPPTRWGARAVANVPQLLCMCEHGCDNMTISTENLTCSELSFPYRENASAYADVAFLNFNILNTTTSPLFLTFSPSADNFTSMDCSSSGFTITNDVPGQVAYSAGFSNVDGYTCRVDFPDDLTDPDPRFYFVSLRRLLPEGFVTDLVMRTSSLGVASEWAHLYNSTYTLHLNSTCSPFPPFFLVSECDVVAYPVVGDAGRYAFDATGCELNATDNLTGVTALATDAIVFEGLLLTPPPAVTSPPTASPIVNDVHVTTALALGIGVPVGVAVLSGLLYLIYSDMVTPVTDVVTATTRAVVNVKGRFMHALPRSHGPKKVS